MSLFNTFNYFFFIFTLNNLKENFIILFIIFLPVKVVWLKKNAVRGTLCMIDLKSVTDFLIIFIFSLFTLGKNEFKKKIEKELSVFKRL